MENISMSIHKFLKKISTFLKKRIPFIQSIPSIWIKRILWCLAGLFILIVLLSVRTKDQSLKTISWAVAEERDFQVDLIESGDVEAISQMFISAPMMWGEKLQVVDLVEDGIQVKKGDFLLQFDVTDLNTSLQIANDRLESLLADLEKLKAQQSLTISNYENNLEITRYSYEQAKLRLDMRKYESEARQEEARLDLKQAEIELEKVKTQLASQKIIHNSQLIQRQTAINEAENDVESIQERINKLQLRAPIDGMVVFTQIRGERVKEGYESRPGWPLMSIPDLSRMQVKVYLNEVDRMKVRPGQKAVLVLDAYPEKTFHGKVREVGRLAQKVEGTDRLKGFVVYLDINESDPILKPGMTAKVRIILEEFENVTVIPVGCVYEWQGQPVVYPKGKKKPYAVYLGARNDGFIVVERGIKSGMRLSWQAPTEQVFALGIAEEQVRIQKIQNTLEQSFSVFENRGILYDYLKSAGISSKPLEDQKLKIDLSKLPPSLRERLGESASKQEKPEVVVGETESTEDKEQFKVSPKMMKRLNRDKQ
jgi:RND family efflux transporter MFP subunit